MSEEVGRAEGRVEVEVAKGDERRGRGGSSRGWSGVSCWSWRGEVVEW
jgi:hypothetical protein